jgi:hypothetical protein
MRLKLDLNIGNGYLYGNAADDSMSYKINIEQGWPDTMLIVPSDLKMNAGQVLITFDTERGNQILVKAKLKNEDTDMIQLFTDLQTLVDLTKRFPLAMNIQKDSVSVVSNVD